MVMIVFLIAAGLGTIYEIYEWPSDLHLGTHYQPNNADTMTDITANRPRRISRRLVARTLGIARPPVASSRPTQSASVAVPHRGWQWDPRMATPRVRAGARGPGDTAAAGCRPQHLGELRPLDRLRRVARPSDTRSVSSSGSTRPGGDHRARAPASNLGGTELDRLESPRGADLRVGLEPVANLVHLALGDRDVWCCAS
jgi:hypothetical protein